MNQGLGDSWKGPGGKNTDARAVSLDRISPARFTNLQEVHDVTRAAGHLDGGEITDAGGGTVNVAAGSGFVRGSGDDTSRLWSFDWKQVLGLAIPTDTLRYIAVDYNDGHPQIVLLASETYDYRTGFPLGFVINEGGTLYINETPHAIGRAVGRLARRNYEVDGRSRAHQLGGLVISEIGTKQVEITAGITWLRGLREEIAAFDSSASDTWENYYRDGVGGFTKETAQNTLPLNLYDDGSGTLQTVGNNNRAVYWFYLGPGGGIAMMYGRGNHNSLAQAQAEQPPGDLPLRLQTAAILLGRFITLRSGGTSAVEVVESAFTETFVTAPVTDHGALAGLADNDHPQYYLSSDGVIQSVQAGTQVASLGQILFDNSNGVSFGMNAGVITATVKTDFALSDHSHGNPALFLTNLSGTTNSNSGGFSLSLSAGAGGGGGDAIRGIAAGGSTATTSTVNFSNSNGISFGFGAAGNSTVITASHNALTSQSNQAASGQNGSFTFQTLSFSNANGVSFGTSAGPAITASHNGLTTAALSDHSHGNPALFLTNLSGTTNSNSAGLTLSLSAGAGGGGSPLVLSYWDNVVAAGSTLATSNGTFVLFPLDPVNGMFPANMTLSTMLWNMSLTNASASGAFSMSWRMGLYTRTSDSMTLINSVSTTFGNAVANATHSSLWNGNRWLTFHSSQWSSAPVLSEGVRYFVGLLGHSSGSAVPFLHIINRLYTTNANAQSGTFGVATAAANTTRGWLPFAGVSSASRATNAGLPGSIARTELVKTGALYGAYPHLAFNAQPFSNF